MLRELIRIIGGKLKHLGYAPHEGLSAVSPLAFSDFSGVATPEERDATCGLPAEAGACK